MRAVLTLSLAVAVSFLVAAAPASAGTNPLVTRGSHLYGEYCLGCHGGDAQGRVNEPPYATGAGPGRAQRQQGGIAPSLRGVGALAADFFLRTGYMPLRVIGPQPRRKHLVFGAAQIRALVAYVASFGGPAIPKPQWRLGNLSQGQHLFTEHCAGCHQVVAQGGYVTGGEPPPLTQDLTPREIAEAVRIGPYVMPTFSAGAITNRQLDSIIRYLEFTRHPYHPGGWGFDFLGPVPEGIVTWFMAVPLLILLCLMLGRRLR